MSLTAHLSAAGQDVSTFGKPMQTWRERMARGMRLKSEGFASTLYDAEGDYPFSRYCRDRGIPYKATGLPVSLDDFADYGVAFQRRFAPNLDTTEVTSLRRSAEGFTLETNTGTRSFKRVVLAIGLTHFARTPEPLSVLPPNLCSHSSARYDLSDFAGRTVAVVGGGSSATDCAVALVEAGATVHVVARKILKFHNPPKPRSVYEKIRWPLTAIGSGWRAVFCTHMPLVFHAMPESFRHEVTRRYLGPASCWFTRETIERSVQVHDNTHVVDASEDDGCACLVLERQGQRSNLRVDHVIAATGYKVDVSKLGFMAEDLRRDIAAANATPILSRTFESSVPGLYFIGVASANSFGPLVRFACGAEFTARRLSHHLAKKTARSTSATPQLARA